MPKQCNTADVYNILKFVEKCKYNDLWKQQNNYSQVKTAFISDNYFIPLTMTYVPCST